MEEKNFSELNIKQGKQEKGTSLSQSQRLILMKTTNFKKKIDKILGGLDINKIMKLKRQIQKIKKKTEKKTT